MAEGVFRERARQAGLLGPRQGIITDSCGTSRYHIGQSPDPRAIEATAARGVDISDLRARQIAAHDFADFDYILAMDRSNFRHLEDLAHRDHRDKLSMFLSHAEGAPLDEVPDPYYGHEGGFGRCLDLIERGADGLFNAILERHFPDHPAAKTK